MSGLEKSVTWLCFYDEFRRPLWAGINLPPFKPILGAYDKIWKKLVPFGGLNLFPQVTFYMTFLDFIRKLTMNLCSAIRKKPGHCTHYWTAQPPNTPLTILTTVHTTEHEEVINSYGWLTALPLPQSCSLAKGSETTLQGWDGGRNGLFSFTLCPFYTVAIIVNCLKKTNHQP